jgi:hypothetical protein
MRYLIFKSSMAAVPTAFPREVILKESSDSHFFTALSAISAAGGAFTPRLISKRKTNHREAETYSLFTDIWRDESERLRYAQYYY